MKIYTHILSHLAQFFYGMRNVSDKVCRENENTNFLLVIFFSENLAVGKILCSREDHR